MSMQVVRLVTVILQKKLPRPEGPCSPRFSQTDHNERLVRVFYHPSSHLRMMDLLQVAHSYLPLLDKLFGLRNRIAMLIEFTELFLFAAWLPLLAHLWRICFGVR